MPHGRQLAPMPASEEERSESLIPISKVLSLTEIAVFVRSPSAKHKNQTFAICAMATSHLSDPLFLPLCI